MILYDSIQSNVTPVAGKDVLTFTGGGTRSFVITEIDLQGMGNSSAANEFGFYRVSVVGTTPTAYTPVPVNAQSPAASVTVCSNNGWSAQPTLGNLVHTCGLNANGQRYFWRAQNLYDVIPVPGSANAAGTLSFRPVSGTSAITARVRHAEI